MVRNDPLLNEIPESHARTAGQKQLAAWLKEGLIEHKRGEKLIALTAKGEACISLR